MKCDLSKDKLIGYFYQELEPDEKEFIEEHLSLCKACKTELASFRKTSSMLQAWPNEDSNISYNFVQEKTSLWKNFKESWLIASNWRKVSFGLAFGLSAVLVFLSLLNFEANYSDGEFNIKLSLFARPEVEKNMIVDPFDAPVSKREFNDWQEKSFRYIQQLIETTKSQQRRELALKFAQFAREWDVQRRHDLQLVGEGLEVFQLTNENRFKRTNEALQELIKVATFERMQSQPRQNK